MIGTSTSSEQEIDPWIVTIDGNQLALWQLTDPPVPALAFFTDRTKAEQYAGRLTGSATEVLQPTRRELLGVMIKCYQQQIQYAVLDPDTQVARRIFKLRDVLKAARGY